MANESTVDQQQLQSTIDELYRKLSELFPAQRDALRNALNTIQVGENQTLGMLAAADDLATAPIGDPSALRDRLNLEAVLGALASLDTLSEAEVGDAAAVRDGIGLGVAATGDAATVRQTLELGVAATGDAPTVRQALELGSAAQQPDSRYAKLSGGANANFSAMPLANGSPIVERGNNTNGYYIKFADGTLICIGAGGTGTYTFPHAFVVASIYPQGVATVNTLTPEIASMQIDSTSSFKIKGWNTSGNSGGASMRWIAIGEWK